MHNKFVKILAIESSCDETAIAIVEKGRKVVLSEIISQIKIHQKYGGVIPELASRYHVSAMSELLDLVINKYNIDFTTIDAIAVTLGPGLTGALLIGVNTAKALSLTLNLPLLGVDHLYAHICSSFIDNTNEPPFIAMLVSGGHTQMYLVEDYNKLKIIGQSLDDAIGEAFDKIARLLELPYPGGPELEKLALTGNCQAIKFPVAKVGDLDFSFSGLKTNVARFCAKNKSHNKADIAACAQLAMSQALCDKINIAVDRYNVNKVVVCGGVSANSFLRSQLTQKINAKIIYPNLKFCTDNAAMVASAAYFNPEEIPLDAKIYSRSK